MGIKKNPFMEEISKQMSLEDRLKEHYLFEFINNNPYATPEDYYIGQLYADDKSQTVMKIMNQWQEDGSPK